MAQRRFGPLVLSVVALALLLLVRLYDVQVAQHSTWANQAQALVRTGHQEPYRRGDILDRRGRVLVQDVESYRVVFAYRDFRREHPLGQVAHALSALEGRYVPLQEAWGRLESAAEALVELRPAELDRFAAGGELRSGPFDVAEVPAGETSYRRGRRGDVAFYVKHLLGLERAELARVTRAVRAGGEEASYLELAGAARRGVRSAAPEELRLELAERLGAARADLTHLSQLLAADDPGRAAGTGALERLLERLEAWRVEVEDGAADDLFEEAAGFESGRVASAVLAERVDFTWLAELLRWDAERTRTWLLGARARWLERLGIEGDPRNALTLPALLVEAELAPAHVDRTEMIREAWTAPFLADEDRREESPLRAWVLGEASTHILPLEVFAELDDLFQVDLPRGERPSRRELFVFQDRERLLDQAVDGCEVLARLELVTPESFAEEDLERRIALDERVRARSEEWRAWRRRYEQERFARGELEAWTRERWTRWEARFQEALKAELDALAARAEGRLQLADGRLDRATERARFALRDHGARRTAVVEGPDYELVHLLARRPHDYAGFAVERSHERVQVPYAHAARESGRLPLVPDLIGGVRSPELSDLYVRKELQREFQRLRRQGTRSASEQLRLEQLAGIVWRSDETYGSGGLEGYFNPELCGRNGYREQRGLQELVERRGRSVNVRAIDGEPLELTIDAELQLAALEVFADPRPAPDPAFTDPAWLARPTGALVLMSVEGEVLAMASFPDQERGAGLRLSDQPLERTLRLYDAQPPGSVLKPFVAAWALDRQGLDPRDGIVCSPHEHADGRAGYRSVHCNLRMGHNEVSLREALRRSCNSYFAWLGDTHYDARSYLQMYAAFGFAEETGVRAFGDRPGLREDGHRARMQPSEAQLDVLRSRMLATNGLGLPQTTVMQIARGYAGLATGRLPDVRIARAAGGEPLAAGGRELPLAAASLERVREALWAVANTTGGSAAAALSERHVGFEVAAKTGSADLERATEGGDRRVLKHAWLASYFPAEAPRAVLVVFCYRTKATASRSAVWIAQQYLQHEAVRTWLEREGVLP